LIIFDCRFSIFDSPQPAPLPPGPRAPLPSTGGRKGRRWAAVLAALALLAGCGDQPTEVEDYEREPVLSAFLTNGQPVDQVYLERVAPLDAYDPEDHGITGAELVVFPVGGGDTLLLENDPDVPGHYLAPAGADWRPAGTARYRLEAYKENDEVNVWAETVVPDTFSIEVLPAAAVGDTVTRLDPNFVLRWTDADSAGGFILNVICLTPEDSLVPLDPDFDPEEDEVDEDYPPRSQMEFMRYDQREATLPWYLFQYEGPHRVDLLAVSALYYEYVTTLFRVGQGQGADIPSNVSGGLGIFAGTTSRSFEVYVKRVG
jgi:hypothetical protein